MNRGHQLEGACRDSNLTAADKAVFLYLLSRADFGTAELPARYTPTRQVIRRKTSLSYSQVGFSTRHLERHGWLTAKGATGPGKPLEYTFAVGRECDCTGRVHHHPTVLTEPATVLTDDPRTLLTNNANAAGHTVSRTVRQREEGVERQEQAERERPDWRLVWRLIRTVHADPCGGIHRDALAEKLGLLPEGPSMREALGIAYRRRQIDFCRQYVVKPGNGP